LLTVNTQLIERLEALERENVELRVRLGLTSRSSFESISRERETVNRIKEEFDETTDDTCLMQCVPEGMLSPDESSGKFYVMT